jgi:spermidine/putrescine transport system substrate-binding protein
MDGSTPRGRIITRRQLLRAGGRGLAGVSAASILAACASGTEKKASGGQGFWDRQQVAGELIFANWPFYMDKKKIDGVVHHPSLDLFTKQTGIQVNYLELIQDYPSFFGKINPILASGTPLGYDLTMMGYPRWFPLMIALDYLIPLDTSRLPNFDKYAGDSYKNPPYDPGHKHGLPFASGMTGIGYDPDLTGREITSIMDLWDPAFKGHVGMFNDTEDMPNFTLLGMGVEPTESTPDDWNAAADLLRKQRDDGILRKYYGQGYIGELQTGDLWLTMAWSPDIHQSNIQGYPNLKFAVPTEGVLRWTDYLCIPQGAEHPLDALTYMDFVYEPKVSAMMTAGIGIIPPVPDARTVLDQQGQTDLSNSPLIFPTPEMDAQIHPYRILNADEQIQWDHIFNSVMEGS